MNNLRLGLRLGVSVGRGPTLRQTLESAPMTVRKHATTACSTVQRRRHYRLGYPITLRPIFQTQLGTFAVLEISEGGIKFRFDRDSPEFLDLIISGIVQFHDGTTLAVEGGIVRIERNRAIAQLDCHIPTNRIRREELQVIRICRDR